MSIVFTSEKTARPIPKNSPAAWEVRRGEWREIPHPLPGDDIDGEFSAAGYIKTDLADDEKAWLQVWCEVEPTDTTAQWPWAVSFGIGGSGVIEAFCCDGPSLLDVLGRCGRAVGWLQAAGRVTP